MNHNIFRTAIIAIGLALSVPAAAREAQRLHPKLSPMTTELSDSKAASEQVLEPRVRGNRNIPSEILPAVPRLKAPVAKNASAAMPVVAGAVISSDSWSGAKKYGVYSLSPSESRLIVDKAKATDGGVLKDNIFYAHELEDDDLFGITVYVNGYDIESAEKVYEGDAFCQPCSRRHDCRPGLGQGIRHFLERRQHVGLYAGHNKLSVEHAKGFQDYRPAGRLVRSGGRQCR